MNNGPRKRRAVAGEGEVQGAQTLDRAVSLLQIVGEGNRRGVRLAELTRLSGLTGPTTHRLVRALERHGLLTRDADTGLFHLGPEVAMLGTIAAVRYDLEGVAAPSLARLAQQTGDTALLTVRRLWHGICQARVEGGFPIRTHVLQRGDRHPLGVNAGGMAILATLSDEDVEQAIEFNTAELADRFPVYTPELLLRQVRETRANGFALNPGQVVSGSVGLAVAIRDVSGRGVGALTIASIADRMKAPRLSEVVACLQAEVVHLRMG